MFRVTFAAPDDFREPLTVDAEAFIGLKSFAARGKRLTTYAIASVEELEPKDVAPVPDDAGEEPDDMEEPAEPEVSDDEIRDEYSGQQRLFD